MKIETKFDIGETVFVYAKTEVGWKGTFCSIDKVMFDGNAVLYGIKNGLETEWSEESHLGHTENECRLNMRLAKRSELKQSLDAIDLEIAELQRKVDHDDLRNRL